MNHYGAHCLLINSHDLHKTTRPLSALAQPRLHRVTRRGCLVVRLAKHLELPSLLVVRDGHAELLFKALDLRAVLALDTSDVAIGNIEDAFARAGGG